MEQNKLRQTLVSDLERNKFEFSDSGLFFPQHGIQAKGVYHHRVNGGEWVIDENLVTKEGLIHILNVAIGSKAKAAGYYLSLFSGATAPAANWTAANYAAVANEIVSLTEGYSNATRLQFTAADATDQVYIDNFTNYAKVDIVTSSQLNVTGSALLTNSQRGGSTGVLVSATKYAAARTFQNGDTFEIGYRIALSE